MCMCLCVCVCVCVSVCLCLFVSVCVRYLVRTLSIVWTDHGSNYLDLKVLSTVHVGSSHSTWRNQPKWRLKIRLSGPNVHEVALFHGELSVRVGGWLAPFNEFRHRQLEITAVE